MASDSGLFRVESGSDLVPLYEAKMLHQFDERWATYTADGSIRDLTDIEKRNSDFKVQPRYWVNRADVENQLGNKWEKDWLLSFRDVCRSTDERTAIFSCLPKVAVNHKAHWYLQIYAKLYGLTRDELRYILDPADVYGSDFPSETFRVLKNNEIKQFGEYRTQRLVLEAWDKMNS